MKTLLAAVATVFWITGLASAQIAGVPPSGGKTPMTAGEYLKLQTPYIKAPDALEITAPLGISADVLERAMQSEPTDAKELALTYLETAAQKDHTVFQLREITRLKYSAAKRRRLLDEIDLVPALGEIE